MRIIALMLALSLIACGGGEPTLGSFAAISKTEGDPPFTLTAPTSNSPGAFTYTSSDLTVATIAGSTVTVVGAGLASITATQEDKGSFASAGTTAVLTVSPRTCISPAVRQNGVCVAPAATGNNVVRGTHTWMPVSFIDTWANADAYCKTTTISGMTGWRLPTEFELSDLFSSGAMNSQGWTLSRTWSSTVGAAQPAATGSTAATEPLRKTVRLNDGVVTDESGSNSAYIACLR